MNLRLYLPLIPLFDVSFADGYRAMAFLSWMPNLLVAELYIRFGRTNGAKPSKAGDNAVPAMHHDSSILPMTGA